MASTPGPRTWQAGDDVTADCGGVLFAGTILGFNAPGLSALIRLTSGVPGYQVDAEIPVPVRLLRAAG